MWHWDSGYSWGMAILGMLTMLLFWGGIAVAIVFLVRWLAPSRSTRDNSAMETFFASTATSSAWRSTPRNN